MNRQAVAPRPVTSVPYLLLCILALSDVVSRPAHAGVREVWVRQHAGVKQANDAANAVAIDAAGNVIATGTADEDCYTVKYSSAGTVLWQRSYNGLMNRSDRCAALTLDAAGNVVVTGTARTSNAVAWGQSPNPTGDNDWYVARYAGLDGGIIWERLFNGPGYYVPESDSSVDVALDGSGNAVVVGTAVYGPSPQFYTVKFAESNGSELFRDYGYYTQFGNHGVDVAADAHGNVATLGINGVDSRPYYVINYNQTGADSREWRVFYSWRNFNESFPVAVVIAGDGDVVVTGYTKFFAGISGSSYSGVALHVARFAAVGGALVWEQYCTNALPTGIAVDANDHVFVTGGSGERGTNGSLILKFSGVDGALLWETRSGDATNNPRTAQKLAVDASGNVVVAGSSYNERGNKDFYTAKYAGADGALLWEIRYNGAADGPDTVRGLALGPDGMVAVSGESTGTNGVTNFTTILYQDDLPSLVIALVPEGVRLSYVGIAGSTYQIERAASVTGPWELIASPVAATGGLVEHVDTNRPPETAFYRVRKP